MSEYLAANLQAIIIATVRMILGILFFFQAYDKVFSAGLKSFSDTIIAGTKAGGIPHWFIRFSASLSSIIELIGGLMLILGIGLPWAYPFLAVNLIMVTLALSYLEPLWDMKFMFPRLVMLAFLMMIPLEFDIFALSAFF